MITVADYFAGYDDSPEITEEHRENALILLRRVNALLASRGQPDRPRNPRTGTQVSGTRDGGWRPKACLTGAPNSAHKDARAVDVYDPGNSLDAWVTDDILEEHGLYREHPDSTPGWSHLTTRAPASGHRTFIP